VATTREYVSSLNVSPNDRQQREEERAVEFSKLGTQSLGVIDWTKHRAGQERTIGTIQSTFLKINSL
jgi:hypothetical protein